MTAMAIRDSTYLLPKTALLSGKALKGGACKVKPISVMPVNQNSAVLHTKQRREELESKADCSLDSKEDVVATQTSGSRLYRSDSYNDKLYIIVMSMTRDTWL